MSRLCFVGVRAWRCLHQCHILQVPSVHYSVGANDFVPRITAPQPMVARLNKLIARKKSKRIVKRPIHFKSPLIVSCRREEFNHHKGQSYNEFNPEKLASYSWKNRKSCGDHFTLMDWKPNPSIVEESNTFKDMELDEGLIDGLTDMGIDQPTRVQVLAIPKILEGHNVICAAETGSGKTLAYLLPLFQEINNQTNLYGKPKQTKSPRCVIMVPSRELAIQIMSVLKQLAEFFPIHPEMILKHIGTEGKLVLDKKMDILVSTPGALRSMLSKKRITAQNLHHLVLDEADTLLDDSFYPEIQNILNQLKIQVGESISNSVVANSGTQMILVGATMPKSLDEKIGKIIPLDTFSKVSTEYLHHVLPHIKHKFVRMLPSSKAEFVLKLAKKTINKNESIILFCKTNSTSFWLHQFLLDNGVSTLLLNGNLPGEAREGLFQKFKNGDHKILVCTDIASRGLDTIHVKLAVNYDFPNFVSDYIHRAGRVGRLGSNQSSEVLSLVAHKWEVEIVWKLETAARKMTSIHNVNANIKRKHEGRHSQKAR